MRQVYSPANAAEAYMLAHLLEQKGIAAHVQGEALQGAVGELPAMALLQLTVADEDYDAARGIVLQWERDQPPPESVDPGSRAPKTPWLLLIFALLVGGVSGWVVKDRLGTLPIDGAEVAFDDNGDGVLEGRFYYPVGGTFASRMEEDDNFDGRVDVRARYDARGAVLREERDQDFDGFFETVTTYEHGNVHRVSIDADSNGVADIVSHHRLGVLRQTDYLDSASGRIARSDYFNDLRMTQSDHDLDGDGFMETRRTYNPLGEITGTQTRTRP